MLYIIIGILLLLTIAIKKMDLIIVLVCSFIIVTGCFLSFTHKPFVEEPENVVQIDTLSLKDSVYILIKDLNIKHPEIVLAQAQLESSFNSKLYRTNWNLFGMKQAKQRPNTALGTKNNHAYYENWQMSVVDYALYQSSYMRDCKTEESYYAKLHNNYAKDPSYISKLKVIVQKIKENDNSKKKNL